MLELDAQAISPLFAGQIARLDESGTSKAYGDWFLPLSLQTEEYPVTSKGMKGVHLQDAWAHLFNSEGGLLANQSDSLVTKFVAYTLATASPARVRRVLEKEESVFLVHPVEDSALSFGVRVEPDAVTLLVAAADYQFLPSVYIAITVHRDGNVQSARGQLRAAIEEGDTVYQKARASMKRLETYGTTKVFTKTQYIELAEAEGRLRELFDKGQYNPVREVINVL